MILVIQILGFAGVNDFVKKWLSRQNSEKTGALLLFDEPTHFREQKNRQVNVFMGVIMVLF